MIKKKLIIFFVLLNVSLYSQNKVDNHINVEGFATIKVKPDLAIFTLSIEKNDTIEKNSIYLLNKEIDKLTKLLTNMGFNNKNIKISNYEIYSNLNHNHIKKYISKNVLKVSFKLDYKLVDEFYKNIQNNNISDLEIFFETKISDSLEKISRNNLLILAIEDAKKIALNISNTLNVKIININNVYKNKEIHAAALYKTEMNKFSLPQIQNDSKLNTPFDKFKVEEIELNEKINIIFEIKADKKLIF